MVGGDAKESVSLCPLERPKIRELVVHGHFYLQKSRECEKSNRTVTTSAV